MLENLTTEARNPASERIDRMSALEIVRLMNSEDATLAQAVGREADSIARAIEAIAERLRRGGRLIYLGAGTSGRLGVIDAAECPPTFSTPPELVRGLIAGGYAAMTRSVEGAEDHPELAEKDLCEIGLCERDVVVGIATSGRTPYVVGGLDYARRQGACAVGLSCNREALLGQHVDLAIIPVVGPEVISGSTRLKAGTATKMVLNMLTTGAMVLLRKTYGNLMVDLRASNTKLVDRARRILIGFTGLSREEAERKLAECGGELKTAIAAQLCSLSPEEARQLLEQSGGHFRQVLEDKGLGIRDLALETDHRTGTSESQRPIPNPQSPIPCPSSLIPHPSCSASTAAAPAPSLGWPHAAIVRSRPCSVAGPPKPRIRSPWGSTAPWRTSTAPSPRRWPMRTWPPGRSRPPCSPWPALTARGIKRQ